MKLKYLLPALLIIILVGVFIFTPSQKDPVYNGKTVSQWFNKIEYTGGVTHEDPAVQALVAMGEEAVPYLVKQYTVHYSPAREALIKTINKSPWPKLHLRAPDELHLMAYVPLILMGPKAKSGIPDLLTLVQHTNIYDRCSTILLLGHIQSRPDLVVPVLLKLLESPDSRERCSASFACCKYGKGAIAAAPVLKKLLNDTNIYVGMNAAGALMSMEDSLDIVLPMIRSNLSNANSPQHLTQLLLLLNMKEKAKPAIPLLLEALQNTNAIRLAVTNALKQIDPEAAAKAGIK